MQKCVEETVLNTGISAAFGVFAGSVTACWDKRPVATPAIAFRQALETCRRQSLLCAAAGAAFTASSCFVRGFRERDDVYNHIAGGFAAGAVLGIKGIPQLGIRVTDPSSVRRMRNAA
jgi:hypothetical protein